MNIYQQLLLDFKDKFPKNVDDYLFRISAQSDLEKVKQYGSSRYGFQDMLWDKIGLYQKEQLPKYPILHHEMIIASFWNDIVDDAALDNGTLKHKFSIYEKPFFTVYKKDKLLMIGSENSSGEHNKGTHFFFLDEPLLCLDSLWQINQTKQPYFVEEIVWK